MEGAAKITYKCKKKKKVLILDFYSNNLNLTLAKLILFAFLDNLLPLS